MFQITSMITDCGCNRCGCDCDKTDGQCICKPEISNCEISDEIKVDGTIGNA